MPPTPERSCLDSWRPSGGVGRSLVAVLLNPPLTTSGVRTIRAVDRARLVLGYDTVRIVNLFATPTCSVAELNAAIDEPCLVARRLVGEAFQEASGVLGAWGVSGLAGVAREARNAQVRWLLGRAASVGLKSVWTVGGEPRHPSRWHQYVSDKYGRTAGGTFEARLQVVLAPVPLDVLAGFC